MRAPVRDRSLLQLSVEPPRPLRRGWGRHPRRILSQAAMELADFVCKRRGQPWLNLMLEEKVNMTGVRTQEHGDSTVTVFATLETTGVDQLTRLLGKLKSVRGVFTVSHAIEAAHRDAV